MVMPRKLSLAAQRLEELRSETTDSAGQPLSQEAFANRFKMSRQAYQFWLKDRTPNGDSLRLMAETFGVTTDWLLGIEGAPKYANQWRTNATLEEDVGERVKRMVVEHASMLGRAAPWMERFETATIDGQAAIRAAAASAIHQLNEAYRAFSGPNGRYVSPDFHSGGIAGELTRLNAHRAPLWETLRGELNWWRDLSDGGMIRPGPKSLRGAPPWYRIHLFVDPVTGEYVRRDLQTGVDEHTGESIADVARGRRVKRKGKRRKVK